MNNKRKLRKTINIYKEAGKLLRESDNYLITKRGYDYAGKEISEEEIQSLIDDLKEQREAIVKDTGGWISKIDKAIEDLRKHVERR